MKKFEYKVITPKMDRGFTKKSLDLAALEGSMNTLGRDGWELVSTIPMSGNAGVLSYGSSTAEVIFIYKREVKE